MKIQLSAQSKSITVNAVESLKPTVKSVTPFAEKAKHAPRYGGF